MAAEKNLDKQHLCSKNEFKYLKEKLKQHFLLKKCLAEFMDFNEKLEPYKHYFLTEEDDEQTIVHYHFYKSIYRYLSLHPKRASAHLKKIAAFPIIMQLPAYKSFYFYVKAGINWSKMAYKDAIKNSSKALKNLNKIKVENFAVAILKAKIYANLNNIYFQINEYKKSFIYYHKAISKAEKYGFTEDLAYLVTNFIYHNIALENHSLVKKEMRFFDKIALTFTSERALIFHALSQLECAFFFNQSIPDKEKLLKKYQKHLQHNSNPLHHGKCINFQINILIEKNEFNQAFELCELLDKNFGDKPKFMYMLLRYLSWLCIKDERYVNMIELSENFSTLNINNDLEQLLHLVLAESKKHSKAQQVSVHNLIIDYYQKEGNYKKAFEYSSACLSQLKNFSFESIHQEFKSTIDQLESKQKIEEKNNLIAQQEKLTQYFKEFAYTAAHDLKSPLLTIKKFAEIIKASFNNVSSEKAQEYLEIIVETSARMESFIEEMIEQYNKERYQKKLEIIDLDEIICGVKQNLQIPIEQSNCEIICTYFQPKVYALKAPLEILFQNFISNAIKYRRANVQSFVKIDYTKEGVFSIADNGIGIEKKMCEKIFNPFFQTNDKNIGSGIGLATCKKIIDNFNGKMWVESKLGKGSTFYFTIMQKT